MGWRVKEVVRESVEQEGREDRVEGEWVREGDKKKEGRKSGKNVRIKNEGVVRYGSKTNNR